MKDIKFRDLRPDEIDLRVGSTNESGFSLLLYKDARVDANILDTLGAFNWQCKFYQVKNTMICSVGINVNYDDESKEPLWIWKDDAGDESNTEAVKGEASDSFKRACFKFGLGRKLYTSPFVWIKKDNDNNPKTSHYSVKEIAYDDKAITKLVITNDKTKQIVFSYGTNVKVSQTSDLGAKKGISDNNQPKKTEIVEGKTLAIVDKMAIMDYLQTLPRVKQASFIRWLEGTYKVSDITELTFDQGKEVVGIINGKKNN